MTTVYWTAGLCWVFGFVSGYWTRNVIEKHRRERVTKIAGDPYQERFTS